MPHGGEFPLRLLDRLVIRHFFDHSILHQLGQNREAMRSDFGSYWFFVLVILGPFVEELLFRLPLRLKRIGFAITLTLICYRLLVDHFYTFDFAGIRSYLNVIIAVTLFFITYRFFPEKVILFLKNHYGYFFYFIAIAFALVHLQNFAYFKQDIVFFYPLFVLPQLVMGLFIGYVRLEYGFAYGVLFHSLINSPSFLFSLFEAVII